MLDLGAEVRAHDTHVQRYELDDQITGVDVLDEDELASADAVVIVTDHDNVDYQAVVEHADYIFDSRHRFQAAFSVESL